MAEAEIQKEGTAAKDGRDGDTKGALKVKASVEGELRGCFEAGTLGLVFLGFDLDG